MALQSEESLTSPVVHRSYRISWLGTLELLRTATPAIAYAHTLGIQATNGILNVLGVLAPAHFRDSSSRRGLNRTTGHS
jgi:hypothetical protein